MTCPICGGAGSFARPAATYRHTRDAGSLREIAVAESVRWSAPADCRCCGGAGWLLPADWHRWTSRPRALRLAALNRAGRARRAAAL